MDSPESLSILQQYSLLIVRRRVRLRAFRPVPSVAERLEGTPYAVPASGPDAIGRDGDQEGHGESRGDTRVTAVARRAA